MSHVAAGFVVTDIESLAKTIKEQCPELELVKEKNYRTWVTDHGALAGDYPMPGIYQLKWIMQLIKDGVDVRGIAEKQGVTLPKNLIDIQKNELSLEDQNKLLQNADMKKGYDSFIKTTLGKDAKFVIRYKDKVKQKSAYGIGLVEHPGNPGNYDMVTDFYSQGNGLLNAKGLGKHISKDGKDQWGNELKHGYAVRAAEAEIKRQIAKGNPEYASYQKQVMADGSIKFNIQSK